MVPGTRRGAQGGSHPVPEPGSGVQRRLRGWLVLTRYGLPFLWLLDDLLTVFDPPGLGQFRRYVRQWRDLLDPTAPGPF